MNKPAQFDQYAAEYTATVQDAIGASGESVRFFAALKARLTREALGARRPTAVLDFGCGIGNTTHELSEAFPAAALTGFDPSAESIAVALGTGRGASGRVRFVASGENRLPFADASFDLAFTSCVFHHIEPAERGHWARELARVLVPGAPLFVFEHNPYNPLTRQVVRNIPFDEGVQLLRPSEAVRLLEAAGLRASPPRFYFFFPRWASALRPLEPALRWLPIGAQYYVAGWR